MALNPLPEGFAERVEGGWLPAVCARPGNPDMPVPPTRTWARPRAGGPVRVLFICQIDEQYEVLSLAWSFDLTVDIVPLWRAYSWRENTADPDTMDLLRYCLGRRRYDTIAMASAWLSVLPDDCETRIAELIQEDGVGFVYALPGIFPRVPSMWGKPSPILDPLMPVELSSRKYERTTLSVIPNGAHPLSKCSDFAAMRWATNVSSTATTGATVLLRAEQQGRVLAAAATRGKGRVVAYNRCFGEYTYGYPFLPAKVPPFISDTTLERCGKPTRWMEGLDWADQFYAWLGHCIFWTAQKEPEVHFDDLSVEEDRVRLTLDNRSQQAQSCVLRLTTRGPHGSGRKAVEHPTSAPAGEKTELTLKLPNTGFLGRHTADVLVTDERGNVCDWASSGYTRAGQLLVEHEPDFREYEPNDVVTIALSVTAPRSAGTCRVATELLDLGGRLLHEKAQEMTAATEIHVRIPLGATAITTRLGNLRMKVSCRNESVEVRDQLLVRQASAWDQFHILAYEGYGAGHPDTDVMLRALRDMGHDTFLGSYAQPLRMWLGTEIGGRLVALWMAPRGFDTERVKERVGWLRRFSPALYEMQDEPELQTTPAIEERRNSPEDMARFQQLLRGEYGTLDALNVAWGKQYRAWHEVERFLWHEVDDANWAPWFDSRRDLDLKFLHGFVPNAAAIRETDPAAPQSINPRSLCTFGGVDLRALTRNLSAMSLYTDFCALPPMGYVHLGSRWANVVQSYIGYTWPSAPGKDRITREAFDAVRNGAKQIGWFAPLHSERPPRGRFSYLSPDLTLNEKGRIIARVNEQLLAGPGPLAAITQPHSDGIFVYYPRTVAYAFTRAFMERQLDENPRLNRAELRGSGPWRKQLPCSFVPPLRALGYQFEFGDERDLTLERLETTKAVLLSHVVCLGEQKLQLLRQFVERGGCVIAEAGTARRDDDGRVYPQTPESFRTLFGVSRADPSRSPIVGSEPLTLCGAELLPGVPEGVGPVYRNGTAFFVNSRLANSPAAAVVLDGMLSSCDISPAYALRDNHASADSKAPIASVGVRSRGDLTYLYVTGDQTKGERPFHLALPQSRHLYNLSGDESLGLGREIRGRTRYGEARVYALSPSPVASFRAHAARPEYRLGERAVVLFTLTTEDGSPGDRLIRLDYGMPGNGVPPVLPRTLLLRGGRGELTVKFPLNGPVGTVQVRARDLTFGSSAEARFDVLPRGG